MGVKGIWIIPLIVSILIIGAIGLSQDANAHSTSAYYFAVTDNGDAVGDHKDWMKDLSDDALVDEISIPGTHDTMTSHSSNCYLLVGCGTQSMLLADQLMAGIRFLDIRLRLWYDDFSIYHVQR